MAKKEKNKGSTLGIIIGAVAFAVSSYGVQQVFFKKELELEKVAVEVNKKTPMLVDQYTRLDSAATNGNSNLTYYYSLVDLEKSEVNLDTVNKYVRQDIIENVRVSPELKIFRDNEITLEYKYYDKNGDFVTEISVTPDLYKQQESEQ